LKAFIANLPTTDFTAFIGGGRFIAFMGITARIVFIGCRVCRRMGDFFTTFIAFMDFIGAMVED